jgi:UDP-N-acetylmuramoyl-tripeptide--D-alanyl-D-alanine ligase
MIRDLASLAEAAEGRLNGHNREFGVVSTDSRTLPSGALFVALRGERFDGHEFLPEAARAGAAGVLVERVSESLLASGLTQVVVDDTLAGLSRFARAWRRSFAIPVIGITGSNGKTTAKEMTGAILSRLGPTLVTQGNLNNHIGVPLMLCRIEAAHRHAVIEMGANHQREISHLAALAEPDIGVVLNAGPAHLEGFGGLEGVARGKGEMFEALGPRGTAVINGDDRFAGYWRGLASSAGRVVTFGIESEADFQARELRALTGPDGYATEFELRCPLGTRRIAMALAGTHNVMNALAAAAATASAGADLDTIEQGLAGMRAVRGRLEILRTRQGAQLIDDSYNANPGSVRAGLRALAEVPGERWFVLGEMAELGEDSERLHEDVGAWARECGFSRLLAIGAPTRRAVEAFGAGASWYADLESLIETLRRDLSPQITVLVKGSRVNRLERVAGALVETRADERPGVH